jgi:hypothetical protein
LRGTQMSVTDKQLSLHRQLDYSSVTGDGKRLHCHLCSSPVTAALRTGSYTKFLCQHHAEQESSMWVGGGASLGACVHCGISVYVGGYHLTYTPDPIVCSHSCNKAARLKRRKDACALSRKERPCAACGQQFVPTRSDAKTCSNKCRQALFRKTTR